MNQQEINQAEWLDPLIWPGGWTTDGQLEAA